MKTLVAFSMVVGAVASYMVLALHYGVFQHYPWPHYLLALGGLFWLVVLIRERFTWLRALTLGFSLFLTGLYGWWTLSFSEYVVREHRAKAGEVLATLPELRLPNAAGEVVRLFEGDERAVLLVFYRGFW